MENRISATPATVKLILELQEEFGELLFHQSGGCCDGSAPMCFLKSEFRTGSNDVCLGEINGVSYWMSADQFEYWKHTRLILDVVPGRGSSFSLEIPKGVRFIIRSELIQP